MYHFNHVPSSDPLNHSHLQCKEAVCHSDELIYVFHSSGFVNATYTKGESQLSFDMLGYWTNFSKGNTGPVHALAPAWPEYNVNSNQSISFQLPEIIIQSNYHQQKVR